MNPPQVKPGDNYTVQIFLVNEGKKAIKVSRRLRDHEPERLEVGAAGGRRG